MSKFMNRPPPNTSMPPQQTNQTFVDRIPVGLDHAPPAFDLRGQLIGAGGANLHYIRNETGAVATLRGRGSLFVDPQLGTESQEPMHLYIEHTRFEGLQSAKQLARNLIETLQSELVHFQQVNPPVQTVQYAQQPVMQQQQHPQQVVPSQMSVPPPMHVPPPIVQPNTNGLDHLNNPQVIPQNFLTQTAPPIVPPAQSQQTIIQQPAMIPQTLPIHLHQGNMVLQQQVQPAPTIGNVSIPPPIHHIPVKQGSLVHLQGPPPSVHLSQPPPTTQIVLNQPPQNYQYQYIQQPLQTNEVAGQPNQVTIQHIYQPQHQLQGIVQQTVQPNPQFNHFAQQTIRPQQLQPNQQYIVHNVQGNTAYMVPPPNIIHQQSQPQNIIFQTQPPQIQQIPLHQLQQMQPPATELTQAPISVNQQQNSTSAASSDDANNVKEESTIKSDAGDESPSDKLEEKPDTERDSSADVTTNTSQAQPSITQIQLRPTQSQPTVTQVPPPIMAVPPPIQHIVGNTLITTAQPTQTQTHQIYNQIPVSIQQISAPTQQIHVSTPNGQHFLVNAQQWHQQQPQFQQVTQNGNIQSFQLTQPIRQNEIVVSNQALITQSNPNGDFRPQQQHILATTFNPHIQAPVTGMQVQFQPVQQPQIMQQHLIEQQQQPQQQQQQQQQTQQQQVQQLINTIPPPTGCFAGNQPPQTMESKMNLQYPQRNSPQPVPYPQSKSNIIDSHLRAGQKRKFDDDDGCQQLPPRMGMGSNSGSYLNNQRDGPHNNSNMGNGGQAGTTSSSSNSQDESNGDGSFIPHSGNNKSSPHLIDQQSPPSSSSFLSDNRPFYQRDNGDMGYRTEEPPHRNPFDMPPSGRGQRFRPNNNRDFPYPMRPPHMQDSHNFPMHRNYFGPPPPPPPYPHRNDFRGPW